MEYHDYVSDNSGWTNWPGVFLSFSDAVEFTRWQSRDYRLMVEAGRLWLGLWRYIPGLEESEFLERWPLIIKAEKRFRRRFAAIYGIPEW